MSEPNLPLKIDVRCPSCTGRGEMRIEQNILKGSPRGVTAMNVAENLICEHSFVVYVDNNLIVRDSFICDFKIQLPDVELDNFSISNSLSIKYDIEIIKYNNIPSFVINVLQCIFKNKKIAILSDDDYINEIRLEFFKYITENSFDIDMIAISREEYRKNKNQYKDYIVLEKNDIIYDKDKIINIKKQTIESTIVQKFFAEIDPEISLIILRNELYKISKFSKDIIKFNEDYNENNCYTKVQLIDFFKDKYKIQVQYPYLMFLEDIVTTYFKIHLFKADKTSDFFVLF